MMNLNVEWLGQMSCGWSLVQSTLYPQKPQNKKGKVVPEYLLHNSAAG